MGCGVLRWRMEDEGEVWRWSVELEDGKWEIGGGLRGMETEDGDGVWRWRMEVGYGDGVCF